LLLPQGSPCLPKLQQFFFPYIPVAIEVKGSIDRLKPCHTVQQDSDPTVLLLQRKRKIAVLRRSTRVTWRSWLPRPKPHSTRLDRSRHYHRHLRRREIPFFYQRAFIPHEIGGSIP